MSMPPSDEAHDDHVYSMVSIYADTFRFLLAALRFYKKLLERDRDTLNADSELKELLSAEPSDTSILERELRRVDRAIA